MNIKRRARWITLIALAAVMTGCAHYSPRTPQVFTIYNSDVNAEIAAGTWITAYESMPQGTQAQLDAKASYRNHLLDEFIWSVDRNYERFEVAFYANVAKSDIAADWLGLLLGGAATLTGNGHTKTILALSATTILGMKSSVDSHWYANSQRDAVVAEMRALRSTQLLLIEQSMTDSVRAYSLDQGISDIQAYFAAGTLVSALQAIAESANSQNAAAQQIMESMRRPCQKVTPCP